MYDFLRKVPLFAGLSETDLEQLCQMVTEIHLRAGEELFAEGSLGDQAYVIRDGQLEIIKTSGLRPVLLAVRGPGDVIGELSLLEETPRIAGARARSDASLLTVRQEQLDYLLSTSASASRAMLHTVLARLRSTESLLRQSEKMAQIGILTAGIAHELNNPAAAVKRGAEQLQNALAQTAQAHERVARLNLPQEQQQTLLGLAQQARLRAARPATPTALARSDQEYALEVWLDEHGAANAWELAPILVDLGYSEADLAGIAEQFGSEHVVTVVDWLSATYSAANLLAEISQGATRISEIVRALTSYAYLDRAPVQAVDIHEGLDNTLLILRSKLKSIEVEKEYALDLPLIQGYGSELNQVWTNLIDNAADALEGTGTIRLRTRHEGAWVVVEVEDNGPGIPPTIQHRVFDPFFTTKPPGKGTGLGLDISYKIVADRHRGDIKLFSQPGRTWFQVWLPINLAHVQETPQVDPHRAEDEHLRHILATTRTVAVAGISSQTGHPAHAIAAYLQAQGYRILPVHPAQAEILGEKAHATLSAIPEAVDLVLIFLPGESVPDIVDEAIRIGAKTIWMQEGIVHERAATTARNAGLAVVMDSCIRTVHQRLSSSLGQ